MAVLMMIMLMIIQILWMFDHHPCSASEPMYHLVMIFVVAHLGLVLPAAVHSSLVGGHGTGGGMASSLPSWARPSTEDTRQRGAGAGSAYTGVASRNVEGLSEAGTEFMRRVEHRDRVFDEIELAKIDKDVSKLRHIAVDINEEVKRQAGVMDPLAQDLSNHQSDLQILNIRLRAAARKGKNWGNMGRNLVCAFVAVGEAVLLIAILRYIYNHS